MKLKRRGSGGAFSMIAHLVDRPDGARARRGARSRPRARRPRTSCATSSAAPLRGALHVDARQATSGPCRPRPSAGRTVPSASARTTIAHMREVRVLLEAVHPLVADARDAHRRELRLQRDRLELHAVGLAQVRASRRPAWRRSARRRRRRTRRRRRSRGGTGSGRRARATRTPLRRRRFGVCTALAATSDRRGARAGARGGRREPARAADRPRDDPDRAPVLDRRRARRGTRSRGARRAPAPRGRSVTFMPCLAAFGHPVKQRPEPRQPCS